MIGRVITLCFFTARQLLVDRKLWLTLALLAGPAVLVLIIRSVAPMPHHTRDLWGAYHRFTQFLLLSSLLPLVCLVHGISLVATEVESRAIVYLFTRRLRRWTVLGAKFVATATVLAVFCDLSMLALHAAITVGWDMQGLPANMPTWNPAGDLVWYLLVIPAGVVAYLAVFTLIGLVTARPLALAVGYLMVVELVVGSIPTTARVYTVIHQLRATTVGAMPVVAEIFDLPFELQNEVYPVGGQRWLMLLAIAGGAWLLSAALISWRELTPAKVSRE